MAKASLLVIQGVDQGARFTLGDEAIGIGRGVRNEVRIVDTEVSRQHATIHPVDGTYVVTDRDSSNGTFVNGQPVRVRELVNGDRIQIGRSVILFSRPADEDESRYVAEKIQIGEGDERESIVGRVEHAEDSAVEAASRTGETLAPAQSVANLRALYRISEEVVSPSISIEQLLRRVLELTIDVVGADRGCLLLSDPDTGELTPQVFSIRRGSDDKARMPVSSSIVDYVLKSGQGVRTSDASRDRRFEPGQSIVQSGIREALCVPMRGRDELTGVIYLDITTPPEQVVLEGAAAGCFTEEHLRLLIAIARQAALAVENNRYQQALLKAERLAAMGQTIAMLSHHIKNILQGVRGGSYLIDMGLGEHKEELIRKGWGIVEKNQNKIYHLVMDMLTFSKDRQPVLEPADLNETVGEVCELMQARAEECGVKLSLIPADDLPVTTYDTEGIHRAVLNVVTNAIDATEELPDAAVTVETGYDSATERVFVSVSDNGPGIPEDQIERIFNVFESSKGTRGTGLGLAVSQKILREHGGEISVESRKGTGSRFTLIWPRLEDDHRPEKDRTQELPNVE